MEGKENTKGGDMRRKKKRKGGGGRGRGLRIASEKQKPQHKPVYAERKGGKEKIERNENAFESEAEAEVEADSESGISTGKGLRCPNTSNEACSSSVLLCVKILVCQPL